MTYQVLARKWRPRYFSAMVGQTHVLRALINALENNKLHHSYLFTGTRGVGKTTVARILAKSLNCEQGVTAYPCGQCLACREIDEGRFIDLIEVDAASRTKVEDTRELLENVQYAPTRGRYKVYLIDEVHMLSTHSFNALLKTLEEPPPHIKFLLATTDPQKIPATVLSRCLQFNLKRLLVELITQQLTKILAEESISYESKALYSLAQAAEGSLRDALSLLEQAIAYGGGQLSSTDVNQMLGTLDQDSVIGLINSLAAQDAPKLLNQIAQLAEYNPDFVTLLGEILSLLQQIAVAQLVPGAIDINQPHGEAILKLAGQLTPEAVQLFYQIGLLGRRDLPLAPEPRGGFEMVMLRMLAFYPDTLTLSPSKVEESSHAPPVLVAATDTSITTAAATLPTPVSPLAPLTEQWNQLVHTLELKGVIKQLAFNCELKQHEGNHWELVLPPQHKLLLNQERKNKLEELLQQHYGSIQQVHIRVEIPQTVTPAEQQQRIEESRQHYVLQEINNDPFVNYLKENGDAHLDIK
jgi:DNA polymerase-3 subunit gamma/tau